MKGCNRKEKDNWKILIKGTKNWRSKEDKIQKGEHNKEQGKKKSNSN